MKVGTLQGLVSCTCAEMSLAFLGVFQSREGAERDGRVMGQRKACSQVVSSTDVKRTSDSVSCLTAGL